MVRFRNVANDQALVGWWDNGSNQIAFSRGNKAFIAINNDNYNLDARIQVGLDSMNSLKVKTLIRMV